MSVVFVVPCFNAARNIEKLWNSLKSQTDQNWSAIFIDDMSDDSGDTATAINQLDFVDTPARAIFNDEKKFALRNIVETVKQECRFDSIIAVIDGDDQLCNDDTVKILHEVYASGAEVAWTAHKWDINGMNISKELPDGVNPYQYPWCSSHLRTFRAKLLDGIPESNFKDIHGNWFERGYDQALMLPLLRNSKDNVYIPDVCYLYNINSVSVNDRNWAERKQLSTVNLVRSRGYIR